jgi:hypothetical protein
MRYKKLPQYAILASCAIALLTITIDANARTQQGYTKKNGTYVEQHQKSSSDGYRYNNRNSQSNGGRQRDEFSSPPAYNKRK